MNFSLPAGLEMLIWELQWSKRPFITQSGVLDVGGKNLLLGIEGTVRLLAASALWLYSTTTWKAREGKQRSSQSTECVHRSWWWLQGTNGSWWLRLQFTGWGVTVMWGIIIKTRTWVCASQINWKGSVTGQVWDKEPWRFHADEKKRG